MKSKSKSRISSSQVFFPLAAITGCISVIFNITLTEPPLDSGGLTASSGFKFGPTYVVEPKGEHLATIVWLHGLGDNGSSWFWLSETLPLPHIKWIFPTSPVQPLTLFGGLSTTAWFDVIGTSEDASQDVKGMDASAAYVLSLLSTEPPNTWVQQLQYTLEAALHVGYLEMVLVTLHLDAVVGLSGWLPCAKDLDNEVRSYEVESLCPFCCVMVEHHMAGDDVFRFRYGEKSADKLTAAGFENLIFKSFNSLGHNINPEELDEVASWLTSKLELEGRSLFTE